MSVKWQPSAHTLPGGGADSGGTTLVVRRTYLTSGNITPPNTSGSWSLLADTTASIPAVVGDYIEAHCQLMRSDTSAMFLDMVVAVSAAIARASSSQTATPATEGNTGLYPQPNTFRASIAPFVFVAAAEDISGGNVTVQLAVKAGGAGTIYRSTAYPIVWVLKNHGTVGFA